MNKYELHRKYTLDMIDAMIKYAKNINPNTDSDEYKNALFDFATELIDDYKTNWEADNGKLEEITNGGLYDCI